MSQNIYDDPQFFATLNGLWGPSAEQIVQQPALDEEKERPMIFLLRARKPANLPPGDGRAGIL